MMKNSKFYPWIVVGLLWVVALLNYLDRQMLSTMRESMQIDIIELQKAEAFGVLMAIFLYIYGFMSPVAGVIADRVNRKWLIVISLFVWSAVTYGMGMANNYKQLIVLRAILGVSGALSMSAGLALRACYHTGRTRWLASRLPWTGRYMGEALGGFAATVAANYGWHSPFHWFGFVGIIYAVLLRLFLPEKEFEA